jgi:outer membrane protein assembly factor BamA
MMQTDTIKEIKYFGNPTIPNHVFFEMADVQSGDSFDLHKLKQLQQRFIRSGYYDKVSLLAFPKNDGHHVNYYFVERRDFEHFDYGLFFDPRQNPGLMVGYSWDFIKGTTLKLKSRLFLSSAYEDYHLSFYDDYIGHRLFFDFSFGLINSDYLFNDLKNSRNLTYQRRFMFTELGYKLSNRHRISGILERYALLTNDSTMNNHLDEDFFVRMGFTYTYENLDWYLFPKEGVHLKFNFDQNYSDNRNHYFSFRAQFRFFTPLSDSFTLRTGLYHYQATDKQPRIANDHFFEKTNLFGYQDRYLGASQHSLLFNEISWTDDIEYDPNLENDFMYQFGIESIYMLDTNQATNITYSTGLNLSWVYKKNLYKISVTINNENKLNFNLFVKS